MMLRQEGLEGKRNVALPLKGIRRPVGEITVTPELTIALKCEPLFTPAALTNPTRFSDPSVCLSFARC